MSRLSELLGFSPDDKVLIVTGDDLGSSHAANSGVYRALDEGWATSAGLMVPAPWAREAAAHYRGQDVGVHLTVNSEHELFRWGPLTLAPSLLSGEGGFPRSVDDLWDHADLEETRRECRAQIERAIYWGFDITHLDSHLGALALRPEFFDVMLDLAIEFRLPLRLPNATVQASAGFPFRQLANEEGVLFPDHIVSAGPGDTLDIVDQCLRDMQPGVTELVFLPAVDTPELRALTNEHETYIDQSNALQKTSDIARLVIDSDALTIGYRQVRDVQRANQH